MPIGFNPGDLGGGPAGEPPSSRTAPVARDRPGIDDVLDEIGRGLWNWVAVLSHIVSPVVWTRWTTAADERTCPECAPLDGLAWPEGAGPVPPLHPSCRCARLPAYTEWRTREVTDWELRWSPA